MRKILTLFTLMATLLITPILAYADAADTTAPKAEFITLSPSTLAASGGELTVEFIISDEGSGLADTNSNGATIPTLTFKLQNSDKTFSPTPAATLYKGGATYGSYRSLVAIPSTLANGTWELFINPLRDQAGNSTTQISTGLSFLLGSASAVPTSSSPASSGGSGASAPTSPQVPLATPSATATPTIEPTPTAAAIAASTPTAIPTAVVSPTAKPSPTSTATKVTVKKVVPKVKTIICRKGKLVKKVTGINPKCPKGYK